MNIDDAEYIIEKVLSANDCGLTGGHQAGIHIPKNDKILGFFPKLNSKEKNPRCVLHFNDDQGESHRFCFIHYNSRLLGCGTRNEYRLTCTTEYIRSFNLKVDDTLVFFKKFGEYYISHKQKNPAPNRYEANVILIRSGNWKVLHF